jgi:hypothetical protein
VSITVSADDPIAASSLGDLPNAGYSTKRERELTDAIMLFMRNVERDRIWLLSIVIDGRDKFRHVILKEYKGLGLADRLADKVFDYFEQQAGKYPLEQREALIKMDNRQRFGLM